MSNTQAVGRSRMQGQRAYRRTIKIITYLLLLGLSFFYVIPFVWMVSTSLKPLGAVFTLPPQWIPYPPQWINYVEAVTSEVAFIRWDWWLYNSVYISVMVIIGNLLSNTFVAFGFARLTFPGRDFLFLILISTMMLPFAVTMIPLYLTFARINWVDTFLPLIVPAFTANAFFTFMVRQFYLTIPTELDDSARIDGANSLQIYWHIMLPLSKPVLATIAIFSFVGTWNDFLWPLIVIDSPEKWTLQLGLMSFRQANMSVDWNQMMAVSTLMIVPVLLLFFFGQRYFVQGIALTGMKG